MNKNKKESSFKNLKLFLLTIFLLITGFYIASVYYVNVLKVDVLNQEDNELISIYLQDEDGNYNLSTSSSFPSEGYALNIEKSYCVNGTDLEYDSTNLEITLTTSGSESCYLYFDSGTSFADLILMNENSFTSVENAITYIESKTTPTFSTTATTNLGLYATEDNYGTSYYFRGAVDDNWVYYAGIYWRIIRINGDGSVRLIYSGETSPSSSQSVYMTGTGTQIATTAYNASSGNAVYSGYMYTTGTRSGSGTSSTIKGVIDNWYEETLLNTEYENYVVDSLFCVDRNSYTNTSGTTTGTGYGTTTQYFAAYIRNVTNKAPVLTCTNYDDSYTASDSTNGNTMLTYSVGLITADELAYAGMTASGTNTSMYLYTGQAFWTMSPYYYSSGAYELISGASAKINNLIVTSSTYAVRPVISVSGNIIVEGTGTYSDPYIIG